MRVTRKSDITNYMRN